MTHHLDDTDIKILKALQRDARQSHQQVGDTVGLSPSPCSRRIRLMEQNGIIEGYTAKVDSRRIGFGLNVFVSVKLDTQIDSRLVNFEREIARFPEVVDCWLMTGNRDYLMRVVVTDLEEFERFLTSHLTKTIGVASIESSIPVRRVKDAGARVS
ncbi:Lrp/AsnC family transcriptional regulator [Cognatishimia sp. 1_MG-2023]|uniref:Lrp/AsnC family transcriptional regulator n=1 Tax=Cognatishimia sp. 1_MG-2023 TaxID=3062642 RepID=UPI0026E352E0|nr:Lrp/AsnC family transcriptional regulator [Cognatishimia sp. 1_MG-2023]MDO6728257.1 Lrp/AsnC family transcriptional regulator [Cognatishimia sp. 1_MG-2023]